MFWIFRDFEGFQGILRNSKDLTLFAYPKLCLNLFDFVWITQLCTNFVLVCGSWGGGSCPAGCCRGQPGRPCWRHMSLHGIPAIASSLLQHVCQKRKCRAKKRPKFFEDDFLHIGGQVFSYSIHAFFFKSLKIFLLTGKFSLSSMQEKSNF